MTLLPGLADQTLDSQRIFRAVLEAMSRPGRVVEAGGPRATPAGLDPAAVAVLLALADLQTPIWLDAAAKATGAAEYLRFHCGSEIAGAAGRARFALVADPATMPDLTAFDQGTDEHPDRSATVILQVGRIRAGKGPILSGPGIPEHAALEAAGLPPRFWSGSRENHARFPRGVDVILTAGSALAALPRTARVEG